MSKQCIFNSTKICNDCGECDRCDLNSNKKCNNCGECLQLQGFDMKGIKIDEILEEKTDMNKVNEQVKKTENHSHKNTEIGEGEDPTEEELCIDTQTISEKTEYNEVDADNEDFKDMDDNIEFIDDIEGLREMLDGDGEFKNSTYEEFPGFIRVKNNN